MHIDDVKLMYEYNYWANKRILTMVQQVSTEDLMKPNNFSWGSLFGTLVHMLDTEYGWRELCQNNTVTFDLTAADFPDLEAIQTRWDAEEAAMWDYLNSLSENQLNGVIRYEVEEGVRVRVLWHCLYHLVNHGMQHRSEAAVMLTDLGLSPGELDFTVFLNQR